MLQWAHLPESGYSTGNLGFLWYHSGDQDFDWSIFQSESRDLGLVGLQYEVDDGKQPTDDGFRSPLCLKSSVLRPQDGTGTRSSTAKCVLQLTAGDVTSRSDFYVTNLGSPRLILGFPWFRQTSLHIDWTTNSYNGGDLQLSQPILSAPALARIPTISVPSHPSSVVEDDTALWRGVISNSSTFSPRHPQYHRHASPTTSLASISEDTEQCPEEVEPEPNATPASQKRGFGRKRLLAKTVIHAKNHSSKLPRIKKPRIEEPRNTAAVRTARSSSQPRFPLISIASRASTPTPPYHRLRSSNALPPRLPLDADRTPPIADWTSQMEEARSQVSFASAELPDAPAPVILFVLSRDSSLKTTPSSDSVLNTALSPSLCRFAGLTPWASSAVLSDPVATSTPSLTRQPCNRVRSIDRDDRV
ncbi:hypothetical protein EDB87DRAFT_1687374 [Lactarius vividus]|nr:hypothetical protein EDB87DRAFT_1687374 [Lactarius vividus]